MSSTYEEIKQKSVLSAFSDTYVPIQRLWVPRPGKFSIIAFLTHFGDFNAWEYSQKLLHYIGNFTANEIELSVIGIGTVEGAREFSRETEFPIERIYVDQEGNLHKQLGFSGGFGEKLPINPYLKLLPMLAGIGSPGTIQEVLRGYKGDRNADAAWISTNLRLVNASEFDVIGKSGQRPFELATLRLQNMIPIIQKWSTLSPPNKSLITQQGGTLIFKDKELVYLYKDLGILKYTPIEEVLKIVLKT